MSANIKHAEWMVSSTGNHQGLIISESGDNIAVAYDKKDAPLIASAPELLSVLERIVDAGGAIEPGTILNEARAIVAKAKGQQ